MQAVGFFEILVYNYQITRCYILNDGFHHSSIFKLV